MKTCIVDFGGIYKFISIANRPYNKSSVLHPVVAPSVGSPVAVCSHRAIQASLSVYQDLDPELLEVMQLSQRQREEEERQLKLEQETLDQVLKLSMQEK